MCQPTTPSTRPAAASAPTSSATRRGGADPSMTDRCSSRPSTPSAALTSSAASCAHSSHEGPKIPAEPCNGMTRATFTTAPIGTRGTLAYVAPLDYDRIAATEPTGAALVMALSDAERRVTRRLAQVLAQHGCTVARWRALTLLAREGSHDMSEL